MKYFSLIKKNYFIVCIVFFSCMIIFSSCNSKAVFDLKENNEASFSFDIQMGKTGEEILGSFGGLDSEITLFDKTAIEMNFSKAGIILTDISFPKKLGFSLSFLSENLNTLFIDGEQPILIEKTEFDGSLTVNLNVKTMNNLISLMPPENIAYIDLLFAPIFTGEVMTSDEYIDLIAAMYGQTLATELIDARIDFEISVPGIITQATIEPINSNTVVINDKKVLYSLFLHEILSNSKEIKFYIEWKKY